VPFLLVEIGVRGGYAPADRLQRSKPSAGTDPTVVNGRPSDLTEINGDSVPRQRQ